jgi:hypothetical protein
LDLRDREEVEGDCRRLHNVELTSPNVIRVIKSRKVRWAGYVARIRELVGNLKGRDHSENLGVDGRIIIE